MKKPNLLTLFICVAMALLLAPHTYADEPARTLKIVTINVWFGLDGHGLLQMGEYETDEERERRYQTLVDGVREIRPDILFVQEANPLPRYARRLAKDTGMDEIHAVNNGGIRLGPAGIPTNLRMGLAILARPELKLRRVGVYRTSGAGLVSNVICFHLSEVRVLLAGAVNPGDRPLYLFCVHAHSSVPDTAEYRNRLGELLEASDTRPEGRPEFEDRLASSFEMTEQDIRRSIRYIEEIIREGNPFVVAGDFNAYRPVFPSMDEFAERLKVLDSFAVANPNDAGHTWDTSRNPNTRFDGSGKWANGDSKDPYELLQAEYDGGASHRVDYIFLSPHFDPADVLDSRLVFTEPREGVYISDHFGVMTEVALP